MSNLNQLHVHVALYRETNDGPWLTGVRVRSNSPKHSNGDHIIGIDGKLVEEIWDLNDSFSEGSFILKEEDPKLKKIGSQGDTEVALD